VKKSAALVVGALTFGLVLAVAGAAVARSQANEIQLSASLNATQEVPAPTGDVSAARGVFSATVTKADAGAVVTWQLTFSGLSGPAGAAHIHIGAPGQSGPVSVPLCGPCESPASGTANVDATVLGALQTGGAYANIHTAANAPGEIRGQLAVRSVTSVALNARQEVPRPKGKLGRARGAFSATVTKSGTTGTVAWRLTFSRLSGRAAAAHIHIAQRGKAGPVAVPLCGPCRSGVRGNATVNASVLTALEAGRGYVNIHTASNPAGEVRGQIPAVPLRVTTP
jgi:hypothetical protein